MREILSDLVAEEQALDQFLQRVPVREWKTWIPGQRWTIQDTVGYLALIEELGQSALEAPRRPALSSDGYDYEALRRIGADRGHTMRPQDVIEWWRHARASVVDALSRCEESDELIWFDEKLTARTFASFRLMDTWSHGLDIHAAMDSEAEDTPRLRHIAWLGWKTLPHAFSDAGETYNQPVRVEVIGSNYAKWVFGPSDTDQLIKGIAGDWCRVVTHRVDAEKTSLQAHGDVARRALRLAKALV
jgi:uncharacterized protein (TIGR03084 family)